MKACIGHYGDIAQVVKFCQTQHARSSWSDVPFNPVLFKRNMVSLVRTEGSDILVVKDSEQNITGVLLATVDQLIFNKLLYATDVHFMCEAGGVQLLAEFKKWAVRHRASKIIMGIANDDPTGKVHAFYAAIGMRPVGDAWVLDLDKVQEAAA